MAVRDDAFRGWPAEALQFYEGLQADNSKTYWAARQQVYDEMVLGPMTALLAELKSEFGQGKVFRPNRDVRFSADKSPYKLHIGATVGLSYIQLSAKGLAAATGMHRMAADQLDRYRHAVADEGTGTDLEQAVRDVQRHAIDVHGHDSLKTAPKGYSTDQTTTQGPHRMERTARRSMARHRHHHAANHRLPARNPAAQRLAHHPC